MTKTLAAECSQQCIDNIDLHVILQDGVLSCHNYWHWALYHVETGDFESAVGILDKYVSTNRQSDDNLKNTLAT